MMLAWLLACAPDRNALPVLETSTFPDGATIDIPTLGTDVQVTASDADGDALQFLWAVNGIGVQAEDTPNATSTTSTYVVSGANLDGAALTCIVTDGQADLQLGWTLAYVGT